ncbi:hypothetical protein [Streptomyces sp. NPDC048312]|uniref:hypothetical protein n=1 Tax=Streptomyces sp. NPDC048312 TaxID=3155485 RepID=UPI0033FEC7E9
MQRGDGRWRLAGQLREGWLVLRLGGFAGFQSDGVGGQSAGSQCGGQARDDVFVGEVPVEQEDLDQCPGSVALAVELAGLGPPGVMD